MKSDMEQRNSKRIEWIDIAKGITILLVIAGHTLAMENPVRAAIFSFHMPLFFILSAASYHFADSPDMFVRNFTKSFKHLMIPAFLMVFAATLIWGIKNYTVFFDIGYTKSFIRQFVGILVFSSGSDVDFFNVTIQSIGIPWFLVVLFGGRTLFDYIQLSHKKTGLVVWCVVLSVAGVILGKILWLPLSFDISMAVLPFFLIGKEFGLFKITEKPLLKFAGACFVWLVLFFAAGSYSPVYFELSCRRYILYPICFVTAVAGTVMISELSESLCSITVLKRLLCVLGRDSMAMLFIHIIDDPLWGFLWSGMENDHIRVLTRIGADIIVFVVWELGRLAIKGRKK